MKVIAAFAVLCLGMVTGHRYFPNHQPLSDELINYVNKYAKTTWEVSTYKPLCNPTSTKGTINLRAYITVG